MMRRVFRERYRVAAALVALVTGPALPPLAGALFIVQGSRRLDLQCDVALPPLVACQILRPYVPVRADVNTDEIAPIMNAAILTCRPSETAALFVAKRD
jgi:hypothetical protein